MGDRRTRLRSRPQLLLSNHEHEQEYVRRYKSSSMASIFNVDTTLSSPDNEEVVRCIAVALRYHIKRGHALVTTTTTAVAVTAACPTAG